MALDLYWRSTPHCACLIGNNTADEWDPELQATADISHSKCKAVGRHTQKLQSSVRPEVLEELMDGGEGVSELSWIIK